MSVIYEPKGKAGEYAELAVNLYDGCLHGCKYCYGPRIVHKPRGVFHSGNPPREWILERLKKDCERMAGDPREVLFCFTCDPYPPLKNPATDKIRFALQIMEKHGMKATVLTKGALRAERDFDILAANDWSFGTTLSFADEKLRKQWEPRAASIRDRINTIIIAQAAHIRTWVSVEPVIDCTEALKVIEEAAPWVNHFKIGKINYHKYIEDREDWPLFLEQVESLLAGTDYYIKKDLLKAAGREVPSD